MLFNARTMGKKKKEKKDKDEPADTPDLITLDDDPPEPSHQTPTPSTAPAEVPASASEAASASTARADVDEVVPTGSTASAPSEEVPAASVVSEPAVADVTGSAFTDATGSHAQPHSDATAPEIPSDAGSTEHAVQTTESVTHSQVATTPPNDASNPEPAQSVSQLIPSAESAASDASQAQAPTIQDDQPSTALSSVPVLETVSTPAVVLEAPQVTPSATDSVLAVPDDATPVPKDLPAPDPTPTPVHDLHPVHVPVGADPLTSDWSAASEASATPSKQISESVDGSVVHMSDFEISDSPPGM
jgi:hypothetical protein